VPSSPVRRALPDKVQTVRPIHIIGVPLDLGGNRRGVDMGPSAFRIAGLGERLTALGMTVMDEGDLVAPIPEVKAAGDPQKKYVREIARVCERLYKTSLDVLEKAAIPVVLGGDHSLAAGSVAATAAQARQDGGRIGAIWVDAHADMNTPASTGSGNVHGMPLAALLGQEPAELAGIGGFSPKLRPANTVLIGVRNLDEREKVIVRNSGVRVFTMKDIDRGGIASAIEQALVFASEGTSGVHVSFDLDVCDPTIAPGVGTPVKGGLDYREAHMVMEVIADSGLLRALDLVEVNPILDDRNMTATLGVELALSALGQKIL
jgi:arginase